MRNIFRNMKTRIYYHFKKSIKGRIKYMKQMEDYFTYKELYKQTEYKLLFRLPLTTLMLWIINLPTNILNYLYYLKDRRDYERAVVDVEIMRKYIDEEDKKEKLIETPTVESYGGSVIIKPFLDGFSTTSILNKQP